jgi:adenylate cyclase
VRENLIGEEVSEQAVSRRRVLVSSRVQLHIYDNKDLVFSCELADPAVLGRQKETENPPYRETTEPGRRRIVIAPRGEQTVSREYVLVEPLNGDRVRLRNLSRTLDLPAPGGAPLHPGESRELSLPVVLSLGRTTVGLQELEVADPGLQSLARATAPPGAGGGVSLHRPNRRVPRGVDSGDFIDWLDAVVDVLQAAADSADFFDKAAQAAVDLVGLDSARALLLHREDWRVQAVAAGEAAQAGSEWKASGRVLSHLREQGRTFWQAPAAGASLRDVQAVVAAPILNRQGAVIGALYGERRRESLHTGTGPITELEASLVEVLARGVAAGLARLEQEQKALTARVQFEQFFTPQLARQLERQPDLLEGRDGEVTLLFVDIRGFSRASERLGPAGTFAWIGDTMAALSECVHDWQGVLVDYIGDALIAMWGAPEAQPDHARLACRAALDMLARLPGLDGRWRERLGEPMRLGIGVHTGVARVGNMGSSHKFKYGPLGNDVNLASRVEGATKYLKCPLLITGVTRAALGEGFSARRVARVRVVNITTPVDLYELGEPNRPGWPEACRDYEEALALFEQKEFTRAKQILGGLRARHPGDGPALVLLGRAVRCLDEGPDALHPLWELGGK